MPSDEQVHRVNAQRGAFAYPYYIYTPSGPDEAIVTEDDSGTEGESARDTGERTGARGAPGKQSSQPSPGDTRLVVEPVNTGRPDDDIETHLAAARATARGQHNGGLGRAVADQLNCPLLVPVFPRPVSDPVDLTHAVHQLDAETLQIDSGPLARVDRQCCRMIDDARKRLAEAGVDTVPRVALTGFSSSAQFVMRFTALHPDRVAAVTAGGHNGLVILPQAEAETDREIPGYEHQQLAYPVGIADVEALIGSPFDSDAFADTDVFCYLGADDRKDALRWPDAWTDNDLRATAVLVYGPEVHTHRVPFVREAYRDHDVSAVFRTYPDTGHSPGPAVDDVIAFHRQSLAGATATELRKSVRPEDG